MSIKYTVCLLVFLFLMLWLISSANAEYKDPTTKVNVNVQTDLFEKSVEDINGLQNFINKSKDEAVRNAGNSNGNNELGFDQNQIQQETNNLSNIPASDLNGRGQQEMMKQDDLELFVDYNKPLSKQHMVDAKKISTAQDGLLKNLLGQLKKLGVDCKTVKGNKEQEPIYYLQIEKTPYKETIYNQTMCEDLRNKYNCNDSVSLQCIKKGKKFGDWQYRTIRFSGHTLYFYGNQNWGYAVRWCTGRWGWIITPYHPKRIERIFGEYQADSYWRDNPAAIIADFRAYLARHLGVMLEQIREDILFPGRGIDPTTELGQDHRWRVLFAEYEFGYHYRDAHDICLEWSEDWSERCRQQ